VKYLALERFLFGDQPVTGSFVIVYVRYVIGVGSDVPIWTLNIIPRLIPEREQQVEFSVIQDVQQHQIYFLILHSLKTK
jgi:hypothetical protein